MKIRYPYAVKCDGVLYKPNDTITVKDAAWHLERGAVLIAEQPKPVADKPKRGKTASGK